MHSHRCPYLFSTLEGAAVLGDPRATVLRTRGLVIIGRAGFVLHGQDVMTYSCILASRGGYN
jgi:hypothetical protein